MSTAAWDAGAWGKEPPRDLRGFAEKRLQALPAKALALLCAQRQLTCRTQDSAKRLVTRLLAWKKSHGEKDASVRTAKPRTASPAKRNKRSAKAAPAGSQDTRSTRGAPHPAKPLLPRAAPVRVRPLWDCFGLCDRLGTSSPPKEPHFDAVATKPAKGAPWRRAPPARPAKVLRYYRLEGEGYGVLKAQLMGLVRDAGLARQRATLERRDGVCDYYLRDTAARRVRAGVLEVDHTLECQLLAYALMQTPALHRVLKSVDTTARRGALSGQPQVVQSALRPIYSLHNSGEQHEFFNLRLTSHGTNMQKKAVVEEFIRAEERTRRQHNRGGDNANPLAQLVRLLSAQGADRDAAHRAAHRLLAELADNEEQWQCRLPNVPRAPGSISTQAQHETRCLALAEQIHVLHDSFAGLCE